MATDFGKRLTAAREYAKLTQAELARLAKMAQSTVASAESDGYGSRKTVQLAAVCGVNAHWLATGEGQMLDIGNSHPLQARDTDRSPTSLPVQTVPTISWRQMEMQKRAELPKVFRIAAPDAAMAPRVAAGAMLTFSSVEHPRPGDGVLCRDDAGTAHFREYRAGRPGTWEAHAENKAYQPLISDRDGLEVLGVLLGVEARWG